MCYLIGWEALGGTTQGITQAAAPLFGMSLVPIPSVYVHFVLRLASLVIAGGQPAITGT